jgi:hypothetical protein
VALAAKFQDLDVARTNTVCSLLGKLLRLQEASPAAVQEQCAAFSRALSAVDAEADISTYVSNV